MAESRPYLFFDFDGVIADTFAFTHTLFQRVCIYVDEREFRERYNQNINHAFDALKTVDHGDRCDHTLDWFANYSPLFHSHAKPFPGMPEILKKLCGTYTIVIISSAHDSLIESFLQKHELRQCIESVMGAEAHRSKYEKIQMLFAQHPEAKGNSVMITDTLGDINEAVQASVHSIGVTWGFQDRTTLERGNPAAIVEKPEELPGAIANYFANKSTEARPLL